nr:hypothetical protein [Tanacetum cinerariifolium]
MASMRIYSSILVVMILLSFGFNALSDSGIGTINAPPYLPSSCYGYQDKGVMIAAANEALFQGRVACGKHFQVTCTGGTNLELELLQTMREFHSCKQEEGQSVSSYVLKIV